MESNGPALPGADYNQASKEKEVTNILQRTFKGAVGLAVLLAVMTISSAPAWAQICQATSDSETVRAEGITEVVGNIELQCRVEGTQLGFGLAADDDVEISIKLNTHITNAVNARGEVTLTSSTVANGEDSGTDSLGAAVISGGQIAVFAAPVGTADTTAGDDFDATAFRAFEISGSGDTITVELEAADAQLVSLSNDAKGFNLSIRGIRANASPVGHDEDIEATVSVNDTVARRSPSKVAHVATGLAVEADRQNGSMCEVPGERGTDEMAEITVGEAFMTALQAGHVLTVTFSDVPDGAMVVVEQMIGGEETGTAPEVRAAGLTLTTGGIGSGVTRIRSGANAGKYMVDLSPTGTGAIIYNYDIGTMDDPDNAGTAITAVRDTTTETFNVPVKFLWEAGAVDTGRAWVNVSYNPVLSVQSGTIPRYVASSESPEVLRVASCDESLMFPFLTNQHGFETGVALTNPTDMDGSCTIEFVTGGRVAMTETMAVGAMSTITFGLSQAAPNFQGHAEAACSFTGGSAFVFIANGAGPMGTPTAAQGYTVMAE